MQIVRAGTFVKFLEDINEEKRPFGLMAGGTDIMPLVNAGRYDKEIIYDLAPYQNELNFIRESEGQIEIGALIRLAEVARNNWVVQHLPQLIEAVVGMGSGQIRNMGTLVGNVANASPIADTAPVLLTKGAALNLISCEGERQMAVGDFFVDYKKTALRKNEIIKSVTVGANLPDGKYGFYKIGTHRGGAISKINLAYAEEGEKVRLAAGGVNKIPTRLNNVEVSWNKRGLSREELQNILRKDISPISDVYSTAEYKSGVLLNLIWQIFSPESGANRTNGHQ